ncbi:MAG: efflux RND transporter periplasmic adaptor subunit [Granulicella sp.]
MVFLSSCVFLFLTACSSSPKPAPVVPVSVEVAQVQRQSISEFVSGGGTIFPLHQASLAPKISSPVKAFYVNRGDRVHRGQLLAVLENEDLSGAAVAAEGSFDQAKANYTKTVATSLPEQMQQAELGFQNANAALDAQQKLYESYLSLYEQHAGARKQVDQAAVALTAAKNQALTAQKQLADLRSSGHSVETNAAKGQMEAARGQYLTATAQLGYTRLSSPIDGVIADRSVYPGDIAQAGTPLIIVMDVTSVIVRLHLPHPQAALLKMGDQGAIHVPGVNDAIYGKIVVISPALDPNSTTVEVWVEAPNPDNKLQPGTSVQVDLLARVVPNATVVPLTSILTDSAGAKSVMTVTSDHHAKRQDVTTGIETGGSVQIVKGLQAGEFVIATGAYGLPDGTKVKPSPVSFPAPNGSQP